MAADFKVYPRDSVFVKNENNLIEVVVVLFFVKIDATFLRIIHTINVS